MLSNRHNFSPLDAIAVAEHGGI